ncbi:MAG: hypothetical protein VKJ04_11965 [Vampirovibrionales bacterium]|nr:hypothetical protein [Vampirovibrionales bacterium]
MSPISGVAQWLGRWNIPAPVENAFTATNKEGPTAILPLEASTLVGRSVSSARRSGFLEFQERLLEELAVAIVWLYGVGFMSRRFNQIKKALFPKLDHLNLETAWDFRVKDKHKNVDLKPSERFTRKALERRRLVNLKFVGLLFSVGIGTMTAALLIPWLNKKKTEAIVAYLDKQEAQKSRTWQELPLSARQFPRHPERVPESLYYQAANSRPDLPVSLSQEGATGLRFGFSGFSDLAQKLGHNIQQSNYGELLAVDGVLTAGRAKVYGDRSPFEAWEIAVRDLGSIYFYMYSAPHIMWLASKAISPMVGADPTLEPKVARLIQQRLLQNLLANAMAEGKLPQDTLATLLKGEKAPALETALRGIVLSPGQIRAAFQGLDLSSRQSLLAALENRWRSVESSRFLNLFELEAKAYGVSGTAAKDYLQSRLPSGSISTDALEALLGAIQKGEGDFSGLSGASRLDLQTAIKQAFRHTAGQSFEMADLKQQPELLRLAQAIEPSSQPQYWQRAGEMASQDARDIANSMFRRCLNLGLALSQKSGDRQWADAGEAMADWLERASVKRRPLGDMLRQALDDFAQDITRHQKAGRFANCFVSKGSDGVQAALDQLSSQSPQEVLSALESLQKTVASDRPPLVSRMKDAFLGRESLQRQLEALDSILRPPARVLESGVTGLKDTGLKMPATLDRLAASNMQAYLDALVLKGRQSGALEPSAQALMETYAKEFSPLLSGQQGRLFSLYVSGARAPIQQKLHELSAGGIQSDRRLLNDGLEVAGRLKTHSRLFNSPKASERLSRQISDWSEQLLKHLGDKPLTGETLVRELETYRRVSQSGHVIARVLALGLSMLGLGIIIPKLQYALTKKLTGKNEHPGLATLHHSDKHTDSWSFGA